MEFKLFSWWRQKRVHAALVLARRPVEPHRVVNPYHAVSIVSGPSCERTREQQAGKRYLSADAPALPLPTCNARSCSCRYKHHEDRRSGRDRRASDVWSRRRPQPAQGDRRTQGRRVTDH